MWRLFRLVDGQTGGRTGLDRPDGQTAGQARRMDRQTDKLDRRTNRHTGGTERMDWTVGLSEGPGGLVRQTDDGPDLQTEPYSFRIDRIFSFRINLVF